MENGRVGLLNLFFVCFYVSALTIGGGYVIVGILRKKMVDELGWLEADEMLNLVAIAQASPGAIAINATNLIGWKLRGGRGAAAAILGAVLPPVVIIIVIGMFYIAFRDAPIVANVLKGMTAGVAAVMIDMVIDLVKRVLGDRKIIPIAIFFAAFAIALFTGVNVVFVLIAAGVIGAIYGAKRGGAL